MKFLAITLTALVATHVVVADVAVTSTQTPKLKKHKQSKVKAQHTERTQSMVHLPAESRIVGGTDAATGAYPFFVQGDGCGGSLIADDIVLTAAHCAGAFDGDVYVGPNQQYSTAGGAERIAVQAEVPHPNYNSNTEAYDFMLLKLARPVSNSNLKPVPLNRNSNNPAPSDVLTVIGFGATSEGGNGSNQLLQVNVDAISFNTCNQQYGGDIINELMLCAGKTGGGKDSCQGDSGGPIFNADGEQVGVVSWGIGCADAKYPGVYSRVSGVIGWIESNACALSSDSCFCDNSCGTAGSGSDSTGSGSDSTGSGSDSTGTQPSAGDNQVVVTVIHDDYPFETGWTLTDDSSGIVVARQAEESFFEVGGTSVKAVILAEGSYTFEMTDTYEDGICCQEGNGEFSVTLNGATVFTGGQFTDSTAKTFQVGGASTGGGGGFGSGAGSGSGSAGSVEYRVDVTYDNYPEETRWILRQVSTGANIVEYGYYDINTEGYFLSEPVDLVPGEEYRLIVRDSIGDGMCCDYGQGSIAVYATVDGVDEELTSSDGFFNKYDNKSFTVSDSYARAGGGAPKENTKAPCIDSTDDGEGQRFQFHVDDKVGNKGCEWLSMNMDRFDYMCEFVDVASICPRTCDSCDLFV
jgi:trypsin